MSLWAFNAADRSHPIVEFSALVATAIVDGLQTTTDGEGYYRICSVPERELLTVIGIHEGVESAGDTLRIEEFVAARVHMLDIERERR